MTVLKPRGDGRLWVKMCGFTDVALALVAVNAGADAVGVVIHEPSPRNASLAVAADIVDAVAPTPVVAVVVDRARDELAAVIEATGVSGVQLHGHETAADVSWLHAEYPDVFVVKARRFPKDEVVWGRLDSAGADAVLVDAEVAGIAGGTGTSVRWQQAEADVPVILAGGLDAANVAKAVEAVSPFGVDVSSGIESSPGRKDSASIDRFMDAVRSVA